MTRPTIDQSSIVEIPERYRDLLEASGFAHIATIGPDGWPNTSPVWYGWDGTHILFSQTTRRQKYRNLKRDPRIALSIIDPANPYRYLEVRGVVEEIVIDEANAFINSMAKKYVNQETYPWHQPGDQRVVVKVRPTHVSHMG